MKDLTVVAVCEFGIIGFLLVVHFALINVLRGQSRSQDRRVDMLLDRLAHAEGRPWNLPPIPVDEEQETEPYTFAPEGEPDLSFTP